MRAHRLNLAGPLDAFGNGTTRAAVTPILAGVSVYCRTSYNVSSQEYRLFRKVL